MPTTQALFVLMYGSRMYERPVMGVISLDKKLAIIKFPKRSLFERSETELVAVPAGTKNYEFVHRKRVYPLYYVNMTEMQTMNFGETMPFDAEMKTALELACKREYWRNMGNTKPTLIMILSLLGSGMAIMALINAVFGMFSGGGK